MAAEREGQRATGPQACPKAFPCRLNCLHALPRSPSNYTPKHGDLSELNVHLARGLRPPPHTPHLAAAQQPLGAPGSLATARLTHQASQQGWLGGPGHVGGSLRGRGFAPTPNPASPPEARSGIGGLV